jgi:AcrR family transcriptional regulator
VIQSGADAIPRVGIQRFSLDDLAEKLGAEPEALRYWFQDETAVLSSLMRIRQQWFIEEAWARLAPVPSHAGKLRHLLELCAADYNANLWIELWKLALRDEEARETRQRLSDTYRDMIARVIRSGQVAGEFGPASSDRVAMTLTALIIGLSVQATLDDRTVDEVYMLETCVATAEQLLAAQLPDPG